MIPGTDLNASVEGPRARHPRWILPPPRVLFFTTEARTLPRHRQSGAGPGNARPLAEICAALCPGGELSLTGAMCTGELARAHPQLTRGSGDA